MSNTNGVVAKKDDKNRYRNAIEIEYGQKRVAELALQGMMPTQIHSILVSEGHDLSLRQVQYDLKNVRSLWMKERRNDYEELIKIELSRLDMMERELWNAIRMAAKGKLKTTIEKLARKRWGEEEAESAYVNDEELDLIINKITETREVNEAPDPRYLSQIIEVHKERRRLLGLYAPTETVNINQEIKQYAIVSPADWPDAPEAKIVDG